MIFSLMGQAKPSITELWRQNLVLAWFQLLPLQKIVYHRFQIDWEVLLGTQSAFKLAFKRIIVQTFNLRFTTADHKHKRFTIDECCSRDKQKWIDFYLCWYDADNWIACWFQTSLSSYVTNNYFWIISCCIWRWYSFRWHHGQGFASIRIGPVNSLGFWLNLTFTEGSR